MAYFTTGDGVPLYYEDEGSGRSLVLLHALMLDASYFWRKNLPELAKTARVIAPDYRGQGLSGKPDDGYTIERYAADLDELIRCLDLENVVLAGLSLGGFVSLEYLRRYGSERIGALALMEMTPRLPSAPGWDHPTFGDFPLEAAQGYAAALRADRSIYREFFHAAFLEPPEGDELEEMIARTWLTPTDVAAKIMDEMVAQDVREDLPNIDLPTSLFYSHPNNRILPTEVGQWMQRQIPDAELVLFAESSHSPFWEEPEKFNRELARVVRER